MVVTDSKIELLLIVIQIAILMYRESSLCSFKNNISSSRIVEK